MSEVEGESLSCNVFGPTGQQYVSPGQRPHRTTQVCERQ